MNHDSPTQPEPNDPRRKWRLIWIVYLVGCGVVWMAIVPFLDPPGFFSPFKLFPDAMFYLHCGFFFFSCVMLGLWLGLGSTPVRWLVVLLATVAIGILFQVMAGIAFRSSTLFFGSSIVGTVAVASRMFRIRIGCFRRMTKGEFLSDKVKNGLQFGIKDMFIWTTGIGVLVGAARLLLPVAWEFNDTPFVFIFIPAIFALMTLLNIWVLLGRSISTIKGVALMLGTALGVYLSVCLDSMLYILSCATLIAQVLLLVALLLLRKQGYRFLDDKGCRLEAYPTDEAHLANSNSLETIHQIPS